MSLLRTIFVASFLLDFLTHFNSIEISFNLSLASLTFSSSLVNF